MARWTWNPIKPSTRSSCCFQMLSTMTHNAVPSVCCCVCRRPSKPPECANAPAGNSESVICSSEYRDCIQVTNDGEPNRDPKKTAVEPAPPDLPSVPKDPATYDRRAPASC